MINQPESNIKLDTEQEAQLAYYQNKLDNFQNEVSKTIKDLTEMRLTLESLEKEKEYKTNLVSNLQEMVDELRGTKEKLQADIQESGRILSENTQKYKLFCEEMEKSTILLSEREQNVVQSEKDVLEKQKRLFEKENHVEEQRALVENAQNTIIEALKSIVWK